MEMVALRLAVATGENTKVAAVVADLVRTHALAGDHLEHVYARAGPERVDLVLFFATGDWQPAAAAAQDICRRIALASPELRRLLADH